MGGSDGERVFADGFYGPPEVDDLVASLEEGRGFVWEVVGDAAGGCGVGLVDVDALDGAAEGHGLGGVRGAGFGGWGVALAADGVVEDEDFGGAGAGEIAGVRG